MQAHVADLIDDIDRSMVAAGNQERIDIRILAATSVDLGKLVEAGRFDEKLYDRLTFLTFYIPPLRERKDDIPPLCSFFLRKFRDEFNKPVEVITPEVVQTLAAYDFPGNVRELAHIIERAVILADGRTIEKKHLPERFQKAASMAGGVDRNTLLSLAALEEQYILEVLDANNGNKSRTAETLGISRAALWRKLKHINAKSSAT
jgi:two-component system response regulator AtoC